MKQSREMNTYMMPEWCLGRTGESPCVQDGAGTGWLAPSTVESKKEGPGWLDHLLFFKKRQRDSYFNSATSWFLSDLRQSNFYSFCHHVGELFPIRWLAGCNLLHPSNPDYLDFSQKAAHYPASEFWFLLFPLPEMCSSTYPFDWGLHTHLFFLIFIYLFCCSKS